MAIEHYIVEVNRPKGVSKARMKAYISEAIDSWAGQLRQDDPLFKVCWQHASVVSHRPQVAEEQSNRGEQNA